MEQNKLLLSPDETCEVLGVRWSTLFRLLESGALPSIKIGRRRRIPTAGLLKWVQRQVDRQTSVQEGER